MFVFVLYAVAVWYFTIRFRRRWPSLAAVVIGFLGLVLVNYLHTKLNDWTNGAIMLPVLRHLMYPYTGLVVFIGLYTACLPRVEPEGTCPNCAYSLKGLPHGEVEHCPECGAPIKGRRRTPRTGPRQPRTLATWKATTRARREAARARAARRPATIAAR